MKEPRQDEFGNWRIFEYPCSVRFQYPIYKVIDSGSSKHKPMLPVGFEFRGSKSVLLPKCYFVEGDNKLDGYTFHCKCVKIADPDSYDEYFKTIQDPDTLRIDYKKAYYKYLETGEI